MKLLDSGFATTCCWVRRLLLAPHCTTLATTLRHFFPLCALIVDSFANMSSGIVLEMEKICGNAEAREDFLWSLERKPQLLGDAAETTHSASPHVAEKKSKMFCNSKHGRKIPANSLLVSLDELFPPSLTGSSSGRARLVTSQATPLLAPCDDLYGIGIEIVQCLNADCFHSLPRASLKDSSLSVIAPTRAASSSLSIR